MLFGCRKRGDRVKEVRKVLGERGKGGEEVGMREGREGEGRSGRWKGYKHDSRGEGTNHTKD
jgi:hypothetical protein